MANLRRGKVTTPHKPTATIVFTRLDGSAIRVPIEHIVYWEEVQLTANSVKLVAVHHDLSCTVVKQTFDAIDELINGKAVDA